ncbi:hypothetical protein Ahy_B04g069837 [Arachis hypogaea]|uniref:Aminotransferase-like plant mobile domain-containing protein n=1 Tax=Arachis hypogaea TaxID=3818 RepID=A0A444ZDP7_ARAHY|nr:hypothetical protein Ahy_B04g069837 [Arachis hypogaea]
MRSHSALLIALVERWRPETHTFHLPVGEVTVTLEDVTCILGLPINGAPVTSRLDSSHQFLVENCIACFGRESGPQDHVLGKVNLAWVRRCRDIEPCDTQESFERYVRAHIFCVLGTVVFSDKSTTSLNSKFLPLLQNGTITLTFRIECLRLKLIHSVINSSKYSVAFDCRYHRLHGTKFHSDPKLAIFRCNIASTYDEGTTSPHKRRNAKRVPVYNRIHLILYCQIACQVSVIIFVIDLIVSFKLLFTIVVIFFLIYIPEFINVDIVANRIHSRMLFKLNVQLYHRHVKSGLLINIEHLLHACVVS